MGVGVCVKCVCEVCVSVCGGCVCGGCMCGVCVGCVCGGCVLGTYLEELAGLTVGYHIHNPHPVYEKPRSILYSLSWSPMVKSPSYTSSLKTHNTDGTRLVQTSRASFPVLKNKTKPRISHPK